MFFDVEAASCDKDQPIMRLFNQQIVLTIQQLHQVLHATLPKTRACKLVGECCNECQFNLICYFIIFVTNI